MGAAVAVESYVRMLGQSVGGVVHPETIGLIALDVHTYFRNQIALSFTKRI